MGFFNRLLGNKDKLRNKEVWNYTCVNGHKWKSLNSPRANYARGRNLCGDKCTRCPKCGTEICKGTVYINGIKTGMGAMHVGFSDALLGERE